MRTPREALGYLYSLGLSDVKLAEALGMSRQYVNAVRLGHYDGSDALFDHLNSLCDEAERMGLEVKRPSVKPKKQPKPLQDVLSPGIDAPSKVERYQRIVTPPAHRNESITRSLRFLAPTRKTQ